MRMSKKERTRLVEILVECFPEALYLCLGRTKEVLKIAPTEPLIEKTDFRMVLPYNAYTLIKRLFDATGTEVKKEEFDINITVEGSLPSSLYPDLKSGAEDIGQGKIILEIIH